MRKRKDKALEVMAKKIKKNGNKIENDTPLPFNSGLHKTPLQISNFNRACHP